MTLAAEPTVEARGEQPYVSIPIRATFKEWGNVNALVPEVFAWLAQKGVAPAGAPFYRYWAFGDMDKRFDLEVGWPVGEAVDGDDRVKAGSIPAGRYLVYRHQGHPDQLGRVHEEVQAWAAAHEIEIATQGLPGSMWSCCTDSFLTDPEEEPDPDRWVTEVAYRVRDGTVR